MPAAKSRPFLRALVNRFFESTPRHRSHIIRRVALPREVHLPNSRVRQQILRILPEQFLSYLRFELDLDRLKILHPALWRDERVVRAEKEAVLQACGGFAKQAIRNVTWRPTGEIIEDICFVLHGGKH